MADKLWLNESKEETAPETESVEYVPEVWEEAPLMIGMLKERGKIIDMILKRAEAVEEASTSKELYELAKQIMQDVK